MPLVPLGSKLYIENGKPATVMHFQVMSTGSLKKKGGGGDFYTSNIIDMVFF